LKGAGEIMKGEDPKFTAYVLGEVDPVEREVWEAVLRENPELRIEAKRVEDFVGELSQELSASSVDAGLDAVRRQELLRSVGGGVNPERWWRRVAVISAMAACVCVGVSIGLLLPSLARLSGAPPRGERSGIGNSVAEAKKREGAPVSFGFLVKDADDDGFPQEGVQVPEWGAGREGPRLSISGVPSVESGGRPVMVRELPGQAHVSDRITSAGVKAESRQGEEASLRAAVVGGDAERRGVREGRGRKSVGEERRVARLGAANRSGVEGVLSAMAARVPEAKPQRGGKGAEWGKDEALIPEAQSLRSVRLALESGKWPEPGSFSAGDLVSAYADLADAGAGKGSMDIHFAAAVAAFGTLLERPESADAKRWGEVLEMGGSRSGVERDEVRTGFLQLVEKARGLAR
jgi:hypothetical protein